MPETMVEVPYQHRTIPIFISQPPQGRDINRGAVILSHGLTNDHRDAPLFAELSSELLSHGYQVIAPDYFGSGANRGQFRDKRLSIMRSELGAVINWVVAERTRFGSALYLFGRSFGGTLSAFYVDHSAVTASVLVSPPINLIIAFKDVAYSEPRDGYVALPDRLRPSGQLRGPYELPVQFFEELDQLTDDVRDNLARGRRVLVLEGLADEKLPRGQMDEAIAQLPSGSEHRHVMGASHSYEGFEQVVASAAVEWFLGSR